MSEPADPTAAAPPPRPAGRGGPAPVWTRRGTWTYRRIVIALFLSGYATFSQLYATQPLLPELAETFGVSAAESSLALSLSTGLLAFSILVAGALAETVGRKTLMFGSLAAAGVCGLAAAAAPNWQMLLLFRALEGLALGGAPAVAMAYLAEEIEPKGLGTAMGLLIGGNALGGMAGRVIAGFVMEHAGWRPALAVVGGLGLASAIGFAALLPASRNFTPRRARGLAHHLAAWGRHLANPALRLNYAVGFLAMGGFVTTYNYIGFRLTIPPFDLGHAAVGMIFTVYLAGVVASPLAGTMSDRIGRVPVLVSGVLIAGLGLAATLVDGLPAIVVGIALLTFGFFTAHTAASGWIGRIARQDQSHAASLYLLGYYLGSSVAGSLGGLFWAWGHWPAVVAFVGALYALTLAAALRLAVLTRATAKA